MLKKLYKYDLKNLSKVLIPLCLSMLGAGVISLGILLLASVIPDGDVLMGLAILPIILLIFGTIVAGTAGSLYNLVYFYRSFFTDQGYLTFSFPASPKTQLNAKILSGVTYSVLCTLSMVISLVLAFLGFFNFFGGFSFSDVAGGLPFEPLMIVQIILAAFYLIITPFSQTIFLYTIITVGSLLFRKHKVGASILLYFGINSVLSTVSGFMELIFMAIGFTLGSLIFGIVFSIALMIGSYFLSLYFLSRRFNLE